MKLHISISLLIISCFALRAEAAVEINESGSGFDYWRQHNLVNVRKRFLILMKTHYDDCDARIRKLRPMTFMYDISPYYEIGYIFSEIMERYRKMVQNVRWPIQYRTATTFATLHRTELVQKLYFEIYHLCMMVHEIPPKYEHMPEFINIWRGMTADKLTKMEKEEQKRLKQLYRDEKRYKDLYKKFDDFSAAGGFTKYTKPTPPRHHKWPLDYGWEIDPDKWVWFAPNP